METAEPVALWWAQEAPSPVIAVAIHAGYALRHEVAALTAVPRERRCREEDAGTAQWATRFPTRLVAIRSRFEIDLNRPRESAVYREANDCWDLGPWREPLPADVAERSRREVYDTFYSVLAGILDRAEAAFSRFVVYDLHSYNHRRDGPDAPPADPLSHPDVNVGTGSMDRDRWAPVVDRFMADLSAVEIPYGEGHLDVRENVAFKGRQLAQWVHDRYPRSGCAIAIEVKKFYMDEHTGQFDDALTELVGDALAATVPGVIAELAGLQP